MTPDIYMDSPPPQNIEAEQSILGAILLENESIEKAVQIIKPDDFYKEAHRRIFKAMIDLDTDMEAIDVITLPGLLKTRDELNKTGGVSYIAMLVNAVPNAANIKHHCKIVREKAILRKLINESSDIITKAYMEPEDLPNFLSESADKVSMIAKSFSVEKIAAPLREMSDVADGETEVIWIVDRIIPEGHITLLQAPKGHAKTWMALYLGVCIASGTAAFPHYDESGRMSSDGRTVKKHPVIYCDRENSDVVVQPRLKRLGCPTGFKSWSYTQEPQPPRIDEPGAVDKWYLPLIASCKPKPVLIYDTLSKFHTAKNENDNAILKDIMGRFKELTKAGATILLLHHASFPAKGEQMEKGRGASAIGDDCDVEWMLDKIQGTKNGYKLRSPKNRLADTETLNLRLAGNEHSMAFINTDIDEPPF